jgi:hypothetical protein
MKLSHTFAWAGVGALLGFGLCLRIIASLEPVTDRYAVLRNGAGLGDLSLLFGFPVAFAVWPFIPIDSAMSDAAYQRSGILGCTLAITLNWALWGAAIGWAVERVVRSRRQAVLRSRPSA